MFPINRKQGSEGTVNVNSLVPTRRLPDRPVNRKNASTYCKLVDVNVVYLATAAVLLLCLLFLSVLNHCSLSPVVLLVAVRVTMFSFMVSGLSI